VLILFLAAMVNSLAFKHYKALGFSRDQKYALSDKTSVSLTRSREDAHHGFLFAQHARFTADLQNLLTEYQYAGKGRSTSSKSIRSGIFPEPRSCSINTRSLTDESLLVLRLRRAQQNGQGLGDGRY